ncbi:MAG TPA: histidine phosphatase family protein [Kofleriaceae bacterium]|nr:histidine phosphatase family protein [Kofleriaceae bacterium]
METTVFLIRHGVTAWHAEGRVLGQRDIPLSAAGMAQAEAAAAAVRGVKMSEVLSSPLQRAIQTAEIIGQAAGIEVARDPRLIDFQLGKWTGMTYDDVAKNEEYQRFLQQPESERIPGGESLDDIRRRAVSAVEQALSDNATGDALAIVTHAGIIRVLITHYMGSPPANYHRVRVSPGSISILGFSDDRQLPRVLAVNLVGSIEKVLKSGSQHA